MEEPIQIKCRELSTSNYIEEDGQIYLAFGWLIQNIYGRITQRISCKMGELLACITVELPSFFQSCYYKSLIAGLNSPINESAVSLPKRLCHINLFVPDLKIDQWKVSDVTKRGICLTIQSQGYCCDRILYSYRFLNQKLYVSMDELYGFGLLKAKTDSNAHSLQLYFYDQKQLEQIIISCEHTIRQSINDLSPDEIIQLWIRAQQLRSGALQYILLSGTLQARMIQEIKFRGWVTGGLSPTLNQGRTAVKCLDREESSASYQLILESMVMGRVYRRLKQTVILHRNNINERQFWRIDKVSGDIGYFTYQNLNY